MFFPPIYLPHWPNRAEEDYSFVLHTLVQSVPLGLFPCLPHYPLLFTPPQKHSDMAPGITVGPTAANSAVPVNSTPLSISWFSGSKFPFHRERN